MEATTLPTEQQPLPNPPTVISANQLKGLLPLASRSIGYTIELLEQD